MFDEVFDRAPFAQVVLNDQGRVARANARFEELFGACSGLAADELFGVPSPELLALVTALLRERRAFEAREMALRIAGRTIMIEAYGSPIESGNGVFVTIVDATERAVRAASLTQREFSESIGRFAGGLAHDLNNLLAAIVATAQAGAADAEDGTGDPGSDFVAIIEEAERGTSLARSLRALAFDETGRMAPVSLAAEVRAAAAVLERVPSAVPLVLAVAEGTPDILGDRARLHQLVLNLLVNARDATPANSGTIEINLRPTPAGGAELVVADQGPGVQPELRDTIFRPYFTTKRRGGEGEARGMGLGLAIVDAVARSTGAEVSVLDRAGGGAEFKVTWPATAVVHGSTPGAPERSAEVAPALVLLADNEVALVGAVARQLRRIGHSVYAAMSAAECRSLFAQYRDSIDVAVLDVKLGDGDGRELALQFREERPDLGIVLMSASRAALGPPDQGARSLLKPFDVQELTVAIERARADARHSA